MATLTYNATRNSKQNVSVTASTSGVLSGTVAVLIDNTTDMLTVQKLLASIIRRLDRDNNKNVKVSTIATSGVTLE